MTGGGRAEHVVSVMPKIGFTEEGDSYTYYRAVCTCNWRSNRFSTMQRGERAALMHRESMLEVR